jgi:glyoxylase I family protein
MARGGINHLALTVSDLDRSTAFYDKVLGLMSYARVEVPEATQQAMKTRLLGWASPTGSVTLRPAKGESARQRHDRNAPGLNHLAFNAENRADVHRMHELLVTIGARILAQLPSMPTSPATTPLIFSFPTTSKSSSCTGRNRKD